MKKSEFNITYRKHPATGNVLGRCSNVYITIFKRPHGGYCVQMREKTKVGTQVYSAGYFSKHILTIAQAKQQVAQNIPNFFI